MAFARTATGLGVALFGDRFFRSSSDLGWVQALPAAHVTALVLVALLSRRWGWFVAAGGLAIDFALFELPSTIRIGQQTYLLVLAVVGGAAVGGVLAVFGVAGRRARLAITGGLAFGVVGGSLLLQAVQYAGWELGESDARRIQLGVPLALCLAAGIAWLLGRASASPVAEVEREPTVARPWMTPVLAVTTAVATTIAYVVMMRVLDGVGRRSASPRRADAVETIDRVGSLGIAAVAALAFAVYAYRRGGSTLARWVLVGFAVGLAQPFVDVGLSLPRTAASGSLWLVPACALAGGIAGAVLSRTVVGVPWDVLGLVALAAAVLLSSPRGNLELPGRSAGMAQFVTVTLAFVLAASLTPLASQWVSARVGGPGEVAALVSLGFGAYALASAVMFPTAVTLDRLHDTGLGPAVMVMVAAVGALALYGLGRVAQSLRRSIEAEARREAG